MSLRLTSCNKCQKVSTVPNFFSWTQYWHEDPDFETYAVQTLCNAYTLTFPFLPKRCYTIKLQIFLNGSWEELFAIICIDIYVILSLFYDVTEHSNPKPMLKNNQLSSWAFVHKIWDDASILLPRVFCFDLISHRA